MRIFFICSISLFFMLSCSDEDLKNYPVGVDFIDKDVKITLIDTFSIKAGTFKIDSLVTSETNRILLGNIKDSNFGSLSCQTYFQVQNSDFTINSDAVYDSIGLVLNYDNYYYGDTTQVQNYKVHRLLEYFEPIEGDDFYNTSKLNYDNEILGEITFTPKPNSTKDSIYIPLNKDIGKDIFDKIRDGEINNVDDFLQYFNGLTIVPDTSINSHVLGFNFKSFSDLNANSSMRIFYTEDIGDSSEGNSQVIDFFISSASKHFNAITTNLDNTLIDDLKDGQSTIYDNTTNQLIFAQAGTGICAKIKMPTLKDLNSLSNNNTVLKAELTFYPLKNSYDTSKPIKDSLAVYVVDDKNRIVKQLKDIDSNLSMALLNMGNDEFNQNIYYSIDLSGFVEEVLDSSFNLNYSIMIQFIDYNKTVDNMIIENFDREPNRIKLSVTYLEY